MPADAEIIRDALNDFQKVQTHMLNAKSENANSLFFRLDGCLFVTIHQPLVTAA